VHFQGQERKKEMTYKKQGKGTHLTLEDRRDIQHGLDEGLSRAQIARQIGKSPSTVSKEIKLHRQFKLTSAYGRNPGSYCVHKGSKPLCRRCNIECEDYLERVCERREHYGVCNKCPRNSNCHLDKYFYRASKAHEEYLYTLKDSREGVNLNSTQMISIAMTIGPLLNRGQSVYQILRNHPEITVTAKTLYTYIESGVFKDYGIDSFSLRRKVGMKPRKRLKERRHPACYDGHRYEDYLEFTGDNPAVCTTEMDTVYNDPEGPYIQTFIFQNTAFMIGVLHSKKTSESMAGTLDYMEDVLGADYGKLFSLLLTDRGPEFQKINLFEVNQETGVFRTNIFYCDPQQASQKPHVENNHVYVRDIIPNGRRLDELSQDDLNEAFSHINSTPRESLKGKTPTEVFDFFYGSELREKLNIRTVDKDEVTLQPYLIRNLH